MVAATGVFFAGVFAGVFLGVFTGVFDLAGVFFSSFLPFAGVAFLPFAADFDVDFSGAALFLPASLTSPFLPFFGAGSAALGAAAAIAAS